MPASTSACHTCSALASVLCSSPGAIVTVATISPSRPAYSGPTFSSLTQKGRDEDRTSGQISVTASGLDSSPRPTSTGYSPEADSAQSSRVFDGDAARDRSALTALEAAPWPLPGSI